MNDICYREEDRALFIIKKRCTPNQQQEHRFGEQRLL